MTVQLVVRPFAPDDIEPVVDLLQDVSAYRPSPGAIGELALRFAELDNCYACVAVHGDRVIAFGSMFVLQRVRGGRSGIIEDIVVAAGERGSGVGRHILEDLVREARARGCFKVSLEAADKAQPFYRAAGFDAAGQAMKRLL